MIPELRLVANGGIEEIGTTASGGWVDVGALKVVSVALEDRPLQAYNLKVDGYHSFFVAGPNNDDALSVAAADHRIPHRHGGGVISITSKASFPEQPHTQHVTYLISVSVMELGGYHGGEQIDIAGSLQIILQDQVNVYCKIAISMVH